MLDCLIIIHFLGERKENLYAFNNLKIEKTSVMIWGGISLKYGKLPLYIKK